MRKHKLVYSILVAIRKGKLLCHYHLLEMYSTHANKLLIYLLQMITMINTILVVQFYQLINKIKENYEKKLLNSFNVDKAPRTK
jgi:hypothetical protein